ncbi:hypothetical protein D9M73_227600 [compost metagenome]|jgi:hypothetical protein
MRKTAACCAAQLKYQGFLIVELNPFVDEVAIEAVVQGDVCDGGAGLVALWALKGLL